MRRECHGSPRTRENPRYANAAAPLAVSRGARVGVACGIYARVYIYSTCGSDVTPASCAWGLLLQVLPLTGAHSTPARTPARQDYFVSLQDFGVWSCFDAGNDEFFYDASSRRYCMQLDHDKCVRAVTAEADEAVQLRVPGEAACLRLDDPQRPLSHHTCDDTRASQRWRFDPALAAFRAATSPQLCLDYSVEDQAFAVWPCEHEGAAQAAQPHAERGFVYKRLQSKYCLRRGHASTCVQEAVRGSSILLRRPTQPALCLQHGGTGFRAVSVECRASDPSQRWIFHSPTDTFRPASDAGLCLDLFAADYAEPGSEAAGGRLGGGTGAGDPARGYRMQSEEEREEHERLTMDGGGALGSWPCIARAPNELFAYDRYMGRYCVTANPAVCVLEGLLGTPLRLRLPNALACLEFHSSRATLQERPCNATEPRQQWIYDDASLLFRHAADSRRCIDFFTSRLVFGVWACRDGQEVNSQQQFRFYEAKERFCLLSDPSTCLQEATSTLLY